MEHLKGRVAVVTGAAGGIGKAICQRFGAEGMQVVAADVDRAALDAAVAELHANSIDAIGAVVDVTQRESLEALRDAAYAKYGAVHVLCNNAGIANTAFGNVWEHENVDWRYSLDVHLFGVINGCAAFLPRMLERGEEGHVVNTVSGNGGIVAMPNTGPYAVAKASVVTYTECLWLQLRENGSKLGVSLLFPSGYTPGLLNTGIWQQKERPAEYAPSKPKPERRGLELFIAQMKASGQEVRFTPLEEVADQVVSGIRRDQFWMIAPSERSDAQIRARAESMLARKHPTYMKGSS
jgi:NAD(P)-dependent dehydrogenase (short-subunit alcohol dehydrogenase family)